MESLKNAINILKSRIANLEKVEDEGAKKEVTDLQALIPEIEEKISDTKVRVGQFELVSDYCHSGHEEGVWEGEE